MLKRAGEIALVVAVWSIAVGYIVYASVLASRHRAVQTVERVDISITDSTADGQLVTSRKVREWILRSGIATIGAPADAVDAAGIRHIIARNGFVDDVDVYVTYSGVMHVDISQRRPMMRLLTDGYNAYVTEDGFIFAAPEASALYVPVVTGSYRPIVPPSYEGYIGDYVADLQADAEKRIRQIEKERNPLYAKEDVIKDSLRSIRRERVKKKWFESKDDFEKRVEAKRKSKRLRRRYQNGLLRDVRHKMDAVTARQDAVRAEQKKNEEKYADFLKLINFVRQVEDDGFWSAEIVQIVASSASSGAMELVLVPRSGDFRIVFGEIGDAERKFDKLMRFYRDGLGKIGWNRYGTINLKYNNQVVCTE